MNGNGVLPARKQDDFSARILQILVPLAMLVAVSNRV
jgi:hypothetical protein